MRMLDLCSGLGGASAAMVERGWDVLRVDIDPAMPSDVCADILEWNPPECHWDLVWCSPPCEQFSRWSMPWNRNFGVAPSMTLAERVAEILDTIDRRWWVVENVKGSINWLTPLFGEWKHRYGPMFLWGEFPDLRCESKGWKQRYSGRQRAQRAMVPYELSLELCLACEREAERLGRG